LKAKEIARLDPEARARYLADCAWREAYLEAYAEDCAPRREITDMGSPAEAFCRLVTLGMRPEDAMTLIAWSLRGTTSTPKGAKGAAA
jgi:hypothetical protein